MTFPTSARPQGGGRFATVTRYKSLLRSGHLLADKDGRVRTHRLVLFEKIGNGPTTCHWCKCPLAWIPPSGVEPLTADHLDGDTWNNDPSNLVPSCLACNAARANRERTHCSAGHALEGGNLYVRPDGGGRQCRTCKRAASKRLQDRRRAT